VKSWLWSDLIKLPLIPIGEARPRQVQTRHYRCAVPDGTNVNHTLVKEGWWYRKYAPGDTFAEQLEKNEAVKVYAKLPGWFKVPTPLGT
jgi:restriction endonuclease